MKRLIRNTLIAATLCASFSAHALDSLRYYNDLLKPKLILPGKNLKDVNQIKIDDEPKNGGLFNQIRNKLTTGGYFRGFGMSRMMQTPYGTVAATKQTAIGEGYFDPFMFMYVGVDGADFSTGAELILANPFTTWPGPGTGIINQPNVFQTLVLRGSKNTKYGNIYGTIGGIDWNTVSKFTLSSNPRYNRFSVFERQPWDGVSNIKDRYASYYYNGIYNIDARYGTQAMKGINMYINQMPWDLDAHVFYGKTFVQAGFDRPDLVLPTRTVAGKLTKSYKTHKIGYVSFHSMKRTDSLNVETIDSIENRAQVNMHNLEYRLDFNGIILEGESGIGSYSSPSYTREWGIALMGELTIPKRIIKYGTLSLRGYMLDKAYVNNSAAFDNKSVPEVNFGYNGLGGNIFFPFAGSMIGVGDIANNRRSLNANTEFKIGRLKVILGTEMQSEIESLEDDTTLAFGHRVNTLNYSRLPNFFPVVGTFGPNGRMNQFYRGVYQTVTVTERAPNGKSFGKRHYNAADLQLKLRQNIAGMDVYFFNLTTVSSIQNSFSAAPVMNSDAYLRALYQETEIYVGITPEFYLALYGGLERIQGNTNITMGDLGVLDITGTGIGFGFDFKLTNTSSIFFRQRFFKYEDKGQTGELLQGREGTIEFKVFF